MKTRTLYICEVCATEYDTAEEAMTCEDRGRPDPIVVVGDIVTSRAGFTWFNGDPAWVSNLGVHKTQNPTHGNCFGPCCTMAFYYVVTVIEWPRHEPRYHLFTLAMKSQYSEGWTEIKTHMSIRKVEDPPGELVEASKALIGKRTDRLI